MAVMAVHIVAVLVFSTAVVHGQCQPCTTQVLDSSVYYYQYETDADEFTVFEYANTVPVTLAPELLTEPPDLCCNVTNVTINTWDIYHQQYMNWTIHPYSDIFHGLPLRDIRLTLYGPLLNFSIIPRDGLFRTLGGTLEYLRIACSRGRQALRTIEPGTFDGFTSLYHLDISGNFINLEYFSCPSQLRFLNLAANRIVSVPVDVFRNCTEITEIGLHSNDIRYILAGTFSYLTRLQLLSLRRNEITMLPRMEFQNLSVNLTYQDSRPDYRSNILRCYPGTGENISIYNFSCDACVTTVSVYYYGMNLTDTENYHCIRFPNQPSFAPSSTLPSTAPSASPTNLPTFQPTHNPTREPTMSPAIFTLLDFDEAPDDVLFGYIGIGLGMVVASAFTMVLFLYVRRMKKERPWQYNEVSLTDSQPDDRTNAAHTSFQNPTFAEGSMENDTRSETESTSQDSGINSNSIETGGGAVPPALILEDLNTSSNSAKIQHVSSTNPFVNLDEVNLVKESSSAANHEIARVSQDGQEHQHSSQIQENTQSVTASSLSNMFVMVDNNDTQEEHAIFPNVHDTTTRNNLQNHHHDSGTRVAASRTEPNSYLEQFEIL